MKNAQGDPAVSAGAPLSTGLLIAGVLVFVVVASAWLSVVMTHGLQSVDNGFARAALERGPHKLMRRIMIVLAVPFVPYILRRAGWRGWRDCGWSSTHDAVIDRSWRRDLAVGIAAGFVTLGVVSALQLGFGARVWNLQADAVSLIGKLAGIAVAAIVIGCLEETLVRGILFRVLERLWAFWPAALISSLLFGYGHYLEADPSAFGEGGVWAQTWNVLVSTLTKPIRTEHFLVNVANLTLMGFALCTVVYRTRTVWMAVGLHAAWVAMIKFNFYSGDVVREAAFSPWIGQRADGTDAMLTCIALALLSVLAAVALPLRDPAAPVERGHDSTDRNDEPIITSRGQE